MLKSCVNHEIGERPSLINSSLRHVQFEQNVDYYEKLAATKAFSSFLSLRESATARFFIYK